MVQVHPRSKATLPIDSPWVVSYSTFIETIIVSVNVSEIGLFDVQF